jgi:DNA-binding NarL/FixJ family response regulator
MSGRPQGTLTIVCGRLPAAGAQTASGFDERPARLGDVERQVAAHAGWTITSAPDEFTLAFTGTVAGLRCALDIQDDFGSKLGLGIGVHAGEASFGRTVMRTGAAAGAADIAACAARGETLASTLVRELAGDADPDICFGEPREFEPGAAGSVRGAHAVTRAAPGPVASLRVVIADDSAIVRDGLAAVLSAAGLIVAAVAGDSDALLSAVYSARPDIAIVDIRMPPTHTDEGLVAAERLRAEYPRIGILVLSQHAEPALAARLLEAAPDGRVGYLLKDRVSELAILIEALNRIEAGETVLDPEVSDRMIQRRARRNDLDELTPRELEVLRLLAEGRSNRAIADALVVTLKTLEGHISQIFLKLGLREAADEHRRVAAVLAYLRQTG